VERRLSTDVHLQILWPKQVPAFQKVIIEALSNDQLNFDDVKSLVSGTTVLTPSPATRGRVHTEGFVHYEAYKGRLAILYNGLMLDMPSVMSCIKMYCIVSESGDEWHPIIEMNGINYAVPTTNMDIITPMEIVEEFGVTTNTQKLAPGAYVLKKVDRVMVEKRHRGVQMVKMDKVDHEMKIPIGFDEGQDFSTITAERFAVGYAKEDGEVVFPYDKMSCKMHSKKGEVYLFGQDYNKEWYPIDVVSSQRNLRMSILKGTYGTCKGTTSLIYSPFGTLNFRGTGIVSTLKALKLSSTGKITYKDKYTDGAVAWLESTFEGCSFDFEEIFGYAALTLRESRCDFSNAMIRQPQLYYAVTVEEVVRHNTCVSGNWKADIKDMLNLEVDNYEQLMEKLSMTSKDYAYVEGSLYDKDDELEVTAVEVHKLWFDYLKIPIVVERGKYYFESIGNKMKSPFVMINVGRYLYENDNGTIKIHKIGSDNDFIVKEVEPFGGILVSGDRKEYISPQGKMTGRFVQRGDTYVGPPEYDRIRVGRDLNEMDTVPAVLGPGDWKSRVNEELQRRGINAGVQIKYEHDVLYNAGVPRYKCFVMFRGIKIEADSYSPSKKMTEQEVAGKVYKVLKKDPI
jgi:hypothetical protein